MTYSIERKTQITSSGQRRGYVGITFEDQWIGYYATFAAAVTALTIRKVPVEQARADVAPHFPHRRPQ